MEFVRPHLVTPDSSHVAEYLDGLIRCLQEAADSLEPDRPNPVVHAGRAAIEAADRLLHLAASAEPSGPERLAKLHEALYSARAAVTAAWFAVVEEGDRGRALNVAARPLVQKPLA